MVWAASATRGPSAPPGCAGTEAESDPENSHSKYSVITEGLVRVKTNAGESCGLESRLVTSVSVASSTGPVGCALGSPTKCPFVQQNAIFTHSTGGATPSTLLDTSSGRSPPGLRALHPVYHLPKGDIGQCGHQRMHTESFLESQENPLGKVQLEWVVREPSWES